MGDDMIGNLDGIADDCVFGWAYDRRRPERIVDVDILVDGRRIFTVPAQEFRGDLPAAGIGSGQHAFSVELPGRLPGTEVREIAVRFAGTDRDLAGSPRLVDPPAAGAMSPLGLKLVRADDLVAAAMPHRATELPVLRASLVGEGRPGRFVTAVVTAADGGPAVERVASHMPEPPAQALSMPFGRVYPWGAFGDRPGRIVDASFQFFDPDKYTPALPAGPGCHRINPRHFRDWVELEDEVVHFARPGAYNHYHWTIDVLPQLWVLRQAPFAGRRLLWNRRDFQRPRRLSDNELALRHDCLRALGFGDQQVVEVEADVVDAPVVHVPAVSLALILGEARPLYEELRARLASPGGGQGGGEGRNLYITRRQAQSRRIVNEDDLVAALGRCGFRAVLPEEMTLAEQISLFAQARVVVAPHGAALANLAYMPEGGRVLEILPANQRDRQWIFGRVAAAFGHRRVVLLADPIPEDSADPDVRVDMAAFAAALEMVLGEEDHG